MLRLFLIALFAVPVILHSQAANQPAPAEPGPVIAELSTPYYPPIARAAHVSGDVVVAITFQIDGSVATATVVSGPMMLRQVALESALKSRFSCLMCESYPVSMQLTYKFELGETIYCSEAPDPESGRKPERPYPQVTHTANVVSIYTRPFGTCDPEAVITKTRSRSIRCLYLWKCAWR
jgi:hypothetical protein